MRIAFGVLLVLVLAAAAPAVAQDVHDVAVSISVSPPAVPSGSSFTATAGVANQGTQGEWVKLVIAFEGPCVRCVRSRLAWVPEGASISISTAFKTGRRMPGGDYTVTADAYIIHSELDQTVIPDDDPADNHAETVVTVDGR
ncbi:MAG: hypothetical protein JSV65_12800 [Armatimonadota bacterium]|nr:MAG: hypothetical protein JSV65_12800 [Armatimonadota bacterium]